MAISFQCPQCQKAFKVKDELAGKKVACTQCKNIMVVPTSVAAPADVQALEAFANAALDSGQNAASNGSATHPVAKPEGKIALECPFCFEAVEFSEEQGGRKAPCPSCRRIVTVPAPKVEKPKDWRAVDEGPALAKKDTGPAPEGAWGNTQGLAGVVSREALLEAEVIVDRKTLAAPKRGWIYLTLGVLLFSTLGVFWTMRGKKAADDQRASMISTAVKAADAKPGDPIALQPAWASVVYCAAGLFNIRESPPDLKAATSYFAAARTAARRAESPQDRAGLLLEVLAAQTELVGDDKQVDARLALPREEAQRELRQTLQMFRELPREYGWMAIETLTRRLGLAGGKEPLVVALAPEALGGDGSRAEALAVVALTLMAQGNLPDKIAADVQAAATGSQSPRIVAFLIAHKQLAEARALIPEATGEQWKLAGRLAYVDGYARSGEPDGLEKAAKIATDGGSPEEQSAALAMLADAAVDAKAVDRLAALAPVMSKHGEKFTLPTWAVDRTARACRRAGKADLLHAMADASKQATVKPWLQLEAMRTELDNSSAVVSVEGAERVGDNTVAQAIAWLELARHNAKFGGGDSRGAINSWTSAPARQIGMAGAALGLQDKRRGK